jgi:aspartate/methionine/tyrosine aminotransferase
LAERLLEQQGLLFAPGHFFGAPGTMRLSWSVAETCLRGGLEILGRALA